MSADWAFWRVGLGLILLAGGAASMVGGEEVLSGLLLGTGSGLVAWVVRDLVLRLETLP